MPPERIHLDIHFRKTNSGSARVVCAASKTASSAKLSSPVRAKLSPKPVHQRVLKHVERMRLELAQEGEQQEARYGRPTRPGRRVGKS